MQPIIAEFDFTDHLKNCFIGPCDPKELDRQIFPGVRPTLHLLRRDLELLYGAEHLEYEKDALKPPFLALIGMLTGFDLMSNLFCGEEELSAEVIRGNEILKSAGLPRRLSEFGTKFKKFLSEIGGMSDIEVRLLWNLRGALVHSYALAFLEKGFGSFEISVAPPQQLLKFEDCHYTLNLWNLKAHFLKTILAFNRKLEAADDNLREIFTGEMVARGYIFIEQR